MCTIVTEVTLTALQLLSAQYYSIPTTAESVSIRDRGRERDRDRDYNQGKKVPSSKSLTHSYYMYHLTFQEDLERMKLNEPGWQKETDRCIRVHTHT